MQTETEIQKLIALLTDQDDDVRWWYILGEENSTDTRVQKVKQLEDQ